MANYTDRFNNLAERVIELLIALAAGSIVFSVSLLGPGARARSEWVTIAWAAELLSVLLGIGALMAYLRFYVKPNETPMYGRRIEVAATAFWLFVAQCATFAAGLAALAFFAFSGL